MFNFRDSNGTFKGLAGECMFKITDKWVNLTRFYGKKRYFETFSKYLKKEQQEFLDKNWYSLDAIKLSFYPKKFTLYEVKTRKKWINPKPYWQASFTQSTVNLYKEAIRLGFEVKIATVWLLENWNYEVELEDFLGAKYYVDNDGTYDRAGVNNC